MADNEPIPVDTPSKFRRQRVRLRLALILTIEGLLDRGSTDE